MKNKKTAIICSLLVTACFIPGIAGASALNANADPVPALQISDEPYSPTSSAKSDASAVKTIDDPFVPPAALLPPAPATSPSPAPAASLPEAKSADASDTPALQISDEPYVPAAAKTATASKSDTSTATNAKTLQAWVDSEPRKIPVKSVTAQASTAATTKPVESIAWSPAIKAAPAADTPAISEKPLASRTPAPAQDEHYKQTLQTMQQQIDQLARDNAALQNQVKTASTVKAMAVPVNGVESDDFFHVKGARNVTIPATQMSALPPIEAQEAKVPADVQKQLDNLKAQNAALQAKVRALDGRSSYAASTTALDDISPASGDTPDDIALPKHSGKKFASLGDIDTEESYLESRKASGLDSDAEPKPPSGKEFAKLLSRYKQSEQENARLGEMVKSSKDQCDTDKKQLESMLFDPKIADEQQRDYVSDLEKQLTDAQATNAEQKRRYELQLRLLKSKLGKRVD